MRRFKGADLLRPHRAVRIVALGLVALWSSAQQPSREYIRLGDRVIAIENTTPSITITPANATLGSLDTLQLTASCGTCTPIWSVTPSAAADVSSGGLLTPHQSQADVQVTATSGSDSGWTIVHIVPVLNPLSPVDGNFPASGGTGTIAVTEQDTWTGHSNAGWIHFVRPAPDASGNITATGPLTVTYSVDGNVTLNRLDSSLTIATAQFAVHEAAPGGSSLTVGPPSEFTVHGTNVNNILVIIKVYLMI